MESFEFAQPASELSSSDSMYKSVWQFCDSFCLPWIFSALTNAHHTPTHIYTPKLSPFWICFMLFFCFRPVSDSSLAKRRATENSKPKAPEREWPKWTGHRECFVLCPLFLVQCFECFYCIFFFLHPYEGNAEDGQIVVYALALTVLMCLCIYTRWGLFYSTVDHRPGSSNWKWRTCWRVKLKRASFAKFWRIFPSVLPQSLLNQLCNHIYLLVLYFNREIFFAKCLKC